MRLGLRDLPFFWLGYIANDCIWFSKLGGADSTILYDALDVDQRKFTGKICLIELGEYAYGS